MRPKSIVRSVMTVLVAVVASTTLGAATAAQAAPSTSSLPRLQIALDGSSVAVTGQKVSGGVQVLLHTTKTRFTQPVLVHLNPGVSYAQAFRLLGSKHAQDINYVRLVGSIVFDAPAPRGTTAVQVNLPAGKYLAVDVTGNGSPSQLPHSTFAIAPSAHPAALPKPAATVHAIEFGFTGSPTLRSGSIVRWQNDGFLVHMFIVLRTTKQYPASRVIRALRTGNTRSLPRSLETIAGAGSISWQAAQQQRLDLRPGTYVVACFMDTQDGREHTMLGMERAITVTAS